MIGVLGNFKIISLTMYTWCYMDTLDLGYCISCCFSFLGIHLFGFLSVFNYLTTHFKIVEPLRKLLIISFMI